MDVADKNGHDRDNNGRFQPGNQVSVNRGPNRISLKVKDFFVKFLEDNVDGIQESFDKLKPLEKLQFIANILPYVVPKLSSAQTENNTKLSGGISINWTEPRLLHTNDKGSNGVIQSIQGGIQDNSEPGRDQVGEDFHDSAAPDSPGA
jgi:hypothetical protein